MTDQVAVEIVNGPQVAAMWRGITTDLEHLDDPMTRALAIAVDAAQSGAPRRTGRLAGSHGTAPGAGANRLTVTNTAPYARLVHNGTRYLRARPWMTDAITSSEPRWLGALTDGVQAGLDRRAAAT